MITKVYILYTGGTIGMAPKDANDPYSPLEPKPLADLLKHIPGARRDPSAKYQTVEAAQLAQDGADFLELQNGNLIVFGSDSIKPVDSSDITPANWREMAKKIQQVYEDYDGFVILHGTDTMAFTSSALSFMFENLAKPVVITGSQLPIASTRTDAVLNFVNALSVAGHKATDLPLIPEVVIVFADRVIRGCRASKVSTADWAGFDSPNFPLLGTIGEHIVINTNYVLPPPASNKKFFVKEDLDESVFDITVFPGFTPKKMEKLFRDKDTNGIVMRTFGTGNVPSNEEFLDIIAKAVQDDKKLIVNLSQCTVGTVEMGLYEASNGLLERGVLSGLDMTPEAALTKLMWTLGTQFGDGRIAQMQISQRGEQTENLFDLRFGGVAPSEPKESYTNACSPDGRLNRDRISRAMLRITQFGVVGANEGDLIRVRAYMNMPSAKHSTSPEEERCVAEMRFSYETEAKTRMKNITYKTQNVIASGDVVLTVLADRKPKDANAEWIPVKIYFKGLYVAIYAKA